MIWLIVMYNRPVVTFNIRGTARFVRGEIGRLMWFPGNTPNMQTLVYNSFSGMQTSPVSPKVSHECGAADLSVHIQRI